MINKFVISICADILKEVFIGKNPSDVHLSYFFKKNRNLGSHDRSNIAEIFYGVIRNKRYLEEIVQDENPKKMILVYLMVMLGKSVRELTPILNDFEVEWLQNKKSNKQIIKSWPVKLSLPDWLWEKLIKQFPEKDLIMLAQSLLVPAQLNLRINTLKDKSRDEVINELRKSFPEHEKLILPTIYSPIGISLPRGTAINKHTLFLDGNIEVQDEGSQILSFLLSPGRGQMVADFCAGAGGKSLAISSIMKNTGRVYAFDISERRLANLKQRLKRSGGSNIMMQRIANENDLKIKRLKGKFDRVIVDAPCTGLGTLRRNPDLKWRQNKRSLSELIVKQGAILNSASTLCKKGGYLVYATCSLLDDENEMIVEKFLSEHKDFATISAKDALEKQGIKLDCDNYLKLFPNIHKTDGFFGALLERID
ncbi:MAG: RsmB/NOP family class I SAM-dependent RNA methyltransferase [Methylophilaceae bacterium]|nr:RsmB/NOP family class I SAM-dependent RNA methyltransferase [Methylophilaceae bacterium]